MRAYRTTRPAGFTLIELLVVMAIIALLASIGVGAYFRIQEAAKLSADEQVVSKFSSALNNINSAELDDANAAFDGKKSGYATESDKVRAICGNDSDRARAVWLYLWMQNAFPQHFAEATNPIVLSVTQPGNTLPTVVTLPARSAFTQAPTLTVGSFTPVEQSAILLHRILTNKGTRGQTLGDEAIGSNAKTVPNSSFQYLTDARARPLMFIRWATNSEINDPKEGFVRPGGSNNDPYDPRSKTRPAKWTTVDGTMGMVPIRLRVAAALNLPGLDFDATGARNFLPTIVAMGTSKPDDSSVPSQYFTQMVLSTPTAAPYGAGITMAPEAEGYIYGYKLRRPGRRGDN